ncbi:MAG: lactate racemase domain-containing protein [Microthrixaceae bacterium]
MKLTIAFDDVSLPLPPMRRPDVRQLVIESVLDLAADAGVDDVHLIAALALHRRMTDAELRHVVGDRVYEAFAPRGTLYNHGAEDPEAMVVLGTTDHGEEVQISKRAAESDLVVYVNLNLVAMDGVGSPPPPVCRAGALRHHHNPATMTRSRSFMDRHNSELHHSNWRQGEVLRSAGVEVFQIETTVNNDLYGDGPMSVLAKRNGSGTCATAPRSWPRAALDRLPAAGRRKVLHGWRAPYGLTSVQAGEVEAVHELTTAQVHRQQLVPVEGQTDVLLFGLPYISPYNVDSIMNPILVHCLGLGYFFNLYRVARWFGRAAW